MIQIQSSTGEVLACALLVFHRREQADIPPTWRMVNDIQPNICVFILYDVLMTWASNSFACAMIGKDDI